MLWTIIVILLILWLIGFVIDLGAIIHLLVIAAIVLIVIRLIQMVTGKK
ncbi:lmo0937 family membrane protein [Salimicrobium jeotgali]|nr:lmo0937 family membrane protein [Salimicrobium jeotgali]